MTDETVQIPFAGKPMTISIESASDDRTAVVLRATWDGKTFPPSAVRRNFNGAAGWHFADHTREKVDPRLAAWLDERMEERCTRQRSSAGTDRGSFSATR